MNTSRRDLLKFLAAGTIITPVAGGATARLIEPPKADIIRPETGIVAPFCPDDVVGAEVTFRMKDGSMRWFEANSQSAYSWKGGDRFLPTDRVALSVLLQRERADSPVWFESVGEIRMTGRVSNRNAVVELK